MAATPPTSIQSWPQFQAYMDAMVAFYQTDIAGAPHKVFWRTLTYEEFIGGNVPNVTPSVKIVQPGDGNNSNLVQALQGVGPLFNPNTGTIGQMPADGTGPWTAAQIQPVIDWINNGCPQ